MTQREQNHETIWLSPWCNGCDRHHHNSDDGRLWCQDNVFDACSECGRLPVKYTIVADQPEFEPDDSDGEQARTGEPDVS